MKAIIIPLILICNLCWGQDIKVFPHEIRLLSYKGTIVSFREPQPEISIDTIPTILLFIETSKKNTNRSCRWVHGYEVLVSSFPSSTSFYLDGRKRRLPKNIIVFMSINE